MANYGTSHTAHIQVVPSVLVRVTPYVIPTPTPTPTPIPSQLCLGLEVYYPLELCLSVEIPLNLCLEVEVCNDCY